MSDAPKTQYARSGDVHVAYQVVGEGPLDLVLVWGTMSHIELFWQDPVSAEFIRRLASFSRLILFDKRGCGLSDRVGRQPTLEERMDDVRAVMDAAGSERAALFGESEGGPMSALFAATYPERTQALVLYGSLLRPVDDEGFPGAATREVFDLFVEWGTNVWGQGEVLTAFAPSMAAEPGAKEVMGAFERAALSPGAFRDLMGLVRDIDIRPVLPAISVPTLVLHRTDDPVTNVVQARILAESIPGARLVELPGHDHLPQAGDFEAVVGEVQEFLTGVRAAPPADRVLATVLFTDIVGSTEAAAELGDAEWRRRLDRHDAIMREHLAAVGGREVKTTGDGFLATFDGPARAIQCATAAARALAAAGTPVRAGLHTGEVERRGDDIGGIAVHVAARVAALAGNGEVLVSRTVRDLVAGSGIAFADRGEHTLKGVPEEWRLYAVEPAG